tara:strand:+ start:4208 stop:4966 length:759 start_codon:yes stop_codon:yes gene_type:complete
MAFAASHSLTNLAARLAHRFKGRAIDALTDSVRCAQLVLLTDGQDIELLRRLAAATDFGELLVLGIGLDSSVAGWAFPAARCVGVPEDREALLWARVEQAISESSCTALVDRPKVFLSHSVQDEGRLFPIIGLLRDGFGLQVFVCADSIPSGSGWHQQIRAQVVGCDRFLFVCSAAARASAFCAFEAGIAVALDKQIRIVTLDSSLPPSHLQNIQAMDVSRLRARKPWLSAEGALLEACLTALAPAAPVGQL